jgi:hypothetical protein
MMRTQLGKWHQPRFRISLRLLLVLPVLCALGCWYVINCIPERHVFGWYDVTLDILVKDAASGQPIPGATILVTGPAFFDIAVRAHEQKSVTGHDGHVRHTQRSQVSAEVSFYRTTGRVTFDQWLEISRDGYETQIHFLSDFTGRIRSLDEIPPPGFAIELRQGPAFDPRLVDLAGRYRYKRGTDTHGGHLEILPDGKFLSWTTGNGTFAPEWSPYGHFGLIRWEEGELLFIPPRGVYGGIEEPRRFIPVRTEDGIYIVPKKDVEKFRARLVNGWLPDSSEFNESCAFKPHSSSPPSSLTSSHGF